MNELRIIRSYVRGSVKGNVKCGDALHFMRSLNDDSAGIIFIDPPFNLKKNYCDTEKNIDFRPVEDYESWLLSLLLESIRILMPGGALYLYHLPLWAMRLGAELEKDLQFQHWIAIAMKNGFVRGPHLYPAHYALLFFTKGKPAFFNRPKLKPSICRHCGDLVKDYGGYRKIIEEKGINLSDFWEDLSPVRHNNRKHRRANELPETLFQRIFEISGSPGELYVDPFAGAGSGVVSSAISGMTFEACDLIPDNCSIICQRLDDLKVDILKR